METFYLPAPFTCFFLLLPADYTLRGLYFSFINNTLLSQLLSYITFFPQTFITYLPLSLGLPLPSLSSFPLVPKIMSLYFLLLISPPSLFHCLHYLFTSFLHLFVLRERDDTRENIPTQVKTQVPSALSPPSPLPHSLSFLFFRPRTPALPPSVHSGDGRGHHSCKFPSALQNTNVGASCLPRDRVAARPGDSRPGT